MPGIDHLSIDGAVEEAGDRRTRSASPRCCCSGSRPPRTRRAAGAWDDEGVVQLATRAIKAAHPDLLVITDVCLCEYTTTATAACCAPDGVVDNDATLELLARTAVSQAAGRAPTSSRRAT